MNIELDLTKKFLTAVDCTGISGLDTYVDIGLSDSLFTNFHFKLENFILNLDDELISTINATSNDLVSTNMSENGFFIIHAASFFISNVKGADIALKILENNILKEKMYKTWEYVLENDDRIYEIIGILKILPDFVLDMKVVCKNSTVKMCFSDFEYIDTYAELNKKIVELNGNYHRLQNKKTIGKLFDLNFINNHLIESIDMDYGETIVKL